MRGLERAGMMATHPGARRRAVGRLRPRALRQRRQPRGDRQRASVEKIAAGDVWHVRQPPINSERHYITRLTFHHPIAWAARSRARLRRIPAPTLRPARYNKAAADLAWPRTIAFFEEKPARRRRERDGPCRSATDRPSALRVGGSGDAAGCDQRLA
jgi:hypothetical protein